MQQLFLSDKQLRAIGFKKKKNANCFTIETINGYFYYNTHESVYVWYHKTIIGKRSNHINLNIKSAPELFIVLSAFKCNFKLVII